ncbi:MAG: hypothetical protein A3D92_24430 [Bacteroidetes bacterium RIFCSPHIGHO2_02_FULL_44_7]|nr:MAG: hypothetical protein A3D92_24430 [Bacteroidetes bacterium RIFCSPHIGHO2_02_FULL_44_7]
MKQLILAGILSFAYHPLSAQVLTINEYGNTNDISGTTYMATLTTTTNDLHIVDFIVNNESGSGQAWLVTRKILSQPAGWSNFFCWGLEGQLGSCYDSSPDIIFDGGMVMIPDGASAVLSTYVTSPGAGCSEYRYYISSDSVNYIDSVDMQVCNYLGLEDLQTIEFTVAPNPAQSTIAIASSDFGAGSLDIIDQTGRIIRTEEIILPYTMSVDALDNGTYFLRISIGDDRILQQKLVVRH